MRLAELERWTHAAISGPEALRELAGERGTESARHVHEDRGVGAGARLAVYANAYFSRIHDVLASDFAALASLVGPAAFHDLARLYLMAHPPTSWSLRDAGRHVSAFLSSPAAALFAERWPAAPDLAALEWALVDTFDAADAAPLQREALAALRPERWESMRLQLVPASVRIGVRWPVHELYAALAGGAGGKLIGGGGTEVKVVAIGKQEGAVVGSVDLCTTTGGQAVIATGTVPAATGNGRTIHAGSVS